MKCPNCGNTLTCGCQKRVASDGAQVCTSCIASYEIKIHKPGNNTTLPQVARMRQDTKPVVTGVNVVIGNR